MNKRTIIIIVIAVFCLVLMTVLLCAGRLQSHDYAIVFGFIIAMAIILLAIDRLKEFDIKNLKVVLSEVKQVKADIYAKAETLRSLAENIADITTILATDRIPQLMEIHLRNERYDRERERVLTRNKVLAILQETGSTSEKTAQTKQEFDRVIRRKIEHVFQSFLHAYANQHVQAKDQSIGKEVAERRKAIDPKDKEALQALTQEAERRYDAIRELNKYVSSEQIKTLVESTHCDLGQVENYLKAKQIWDDRIQEHFETFKAFVKEIGFDMKSS